MNVTSLTDSQGCINRSCITFCDDDNFDIDKFMLASSADSTASMMMTNEPDTIPAGNIAAFSSTLRTSRIRKGGDSVNSAFKPQEAMFVQESDDERSVEASLAKDMAQLSVTERNNALEDIHGVRTEYVHEDPAYVDSCIEQLKNSLNEMRNDSNEKADPYHKALSLGPQYFDRKFYLMFLRAREFNIRDTVNLILNHFAFKLRLFGPEKLAKEITLEDLNEDDMNAMRTGYVLFSPVKDAVGRTVALNSSKYATCSVWDNQLRANWYMHMDLIQNDEVTQVKGIVRIMYEVGRTFAQIRSQGSFKDRLDSIRMYQECLPVRVASLHFCMKEATVSAVVNLFLKLTNKENRIRSRVHFGGHVECQYELLSFGISSLTVDLDGNFKKELVEEYIKSQKALEKQRQQDNERFEKSTERDNNATSKPFALAGAARIVATDKDVLLGRGIPYQNHPGNIRLSKIIEQRLDEFNNASTKFHKTIITWDVLKTVQEEYGGRFLEKDGSSDDDGNFATMTWKVCSNNAARFKVAYGFRSLNKIHRRDAGTGNSTSKPAAGCKTNRPNQWNMMNANTCSSFGDGSYAHNNKRLKLG